MKVFSNSQEKELKKISEYITSKDLELVKVGIACLRSSKVYRDLRPLSLFYYPQATIMRVRFSTWINQRLRIITSKEAKSFEKNRARILLAESFARLTSDDIRKYFRREFVNTSTIL